MMHTSNSASDVLNVIVHQQQMREYINKETNPIWALRNITNGTYLFNSKKYGTLFANKELLFGSTLDSLLIDETTKANLLYKDQLVVGQNTDYTSAELFTLNGKLFMAEVVRWPVQYKNQTVAIGIFVKPTKNLKMILEMYKDYESIYNPIAESMMADLKLRDKLIGVFVLFGLTLKQISGLLDISTVRVSNILGRICRSKFGVAAGGQYYAKKLIELGLYKQIILEIFNSKYSDLLIEAYELSHKA
jgi:hypothetical protein